MCLSCGNALVKHIRIDHFDDTVVLDDFLYNEYHAPRVSSTASRFLYVESKPRIYFFGGCGYRQVAVFRELERT